MSAIAKADFPHSIPFPLDSKCKQTLPLMAGLHFAELKHLLGSQGKKTHAPRIIFLVTVLTSLTFVSWSISEATVRKTHPLGVLESKRHALNVWACYSNSKKHIDSSDLVVLLIRHGILKVYIHLTVTPIIPNDYVSVASLFFVCFYWQDEKEGSHHF